MIICCHNELINDWSAEELEQKMTLLPIALRGKILQKKHLKDIQLSVSGKLLLMQVLKEFDLPLSLSNLEYHTITALFLRLALILI